MSNVFLINLPVQLNLQKHVVTDAGYNPSLGLIYIGTWLEMNGYNPTIIDLCYDKMSRGQLINLIDEKNPLLVGISTYTENLDLAISTAKAIKQSRPNVKIVFGGSHPTLVPAEAICSEYVDFVSRKEGESTLLELAEAIVSGESALRYDDIPGLVFKRDGEVINNKLRGPIGDLDLLPLPKRELVGMERYERIVNISTSRGCPGNCIYCAATALSGASYRIRGVENVFLEIILIKKLLGDKLLKIYIVDDTFTAIPERVIEFTSLIKQYHLEVPWHCESRIDIMTEEMLDLMASTGCIAIQYGMESGSQTVLDKIKKGIDLEHARKIIDYTFKKKITLCLSFMLGHFCDTKETMEETCRFIREVFMKYKAEVAVSYNTPFPGTWQYTHLKDTGMRLVTDKYRKFSLNTPVVETDNFTVNDQRKYYMEVMKYIGYTTGLERWREVLENG